MHKYVQHLVKRLAEERGFRATIEGAAGAGQADVLLERDGFRVGCEISVTTDATHEIENLRKCVSAGFSRVLFISSERKVREKVLAAVPEVAATVPVDVIGPEDIVTALDAFTPSDTVNESMVRGYKVKVRRQDLSPNDLAERRRAVAAVVARSVGKTR